MKHSPKHDFPVDQVRQILEPGPIVLVSSAYKGEQNIMTMGWHTVMEFSPSLVGCIIAASNHSFEMIRKSRECVINVPDAGMVDTVVKVGNSDGDDIDKFAAFGLTAVRSKKVGAPSIRECFASLECRIADARLVNRYNFFIFEVVKAHVAKSPRFPQTLHYHGRGIFTTDGRRINKARSFTKWKGDPSF